MLKCTAKLVAVAMFFSFCLGSIAMAEPINEKKVDKPVITTSTTSSAIGGKSDIGSLVDEKEKEMEEIAKKEAEKKAQLEKENAKKKVVNKYDFDIASYITKYSTSKANANRNYNMKLASDAINGVILNPGDTFSYNQVILSKSNNGKGYKEAGILIDGKPDTGIGGGICQISSTLYEAALYSGMTITQRSNHSAKVGYMPAGRDATVSWGGPDLKFRNNLEVPVKIESVIGNGQLKVRFLSQKNPNIGDIKVNVDYDAGSGRYTLRRYTNGVNDYTAYSKYK